jgi:hypothetical protein
MIRIIKRQKKIILQSAIYFICQNFERWFFYLCLAKLKNDLSSYLLYFRSWLIVALHLPKDRKKLRNSDQLKCLFLQQCNTNYNFLCNSQILILELILQRIKESFNFIRIFRFGDLRSILTKENESEKIKISGPFDDLSRFNSIRILSKVLINGKSCQARKNLHLFSVVLFSVKKWIKTQIAEEKKTSLVSLRKMTRKQMVLVIFFIL